MTAGAQHHLDDRDVLAAAQGITARQAWDNWQYATDPDERERLRLVFVACVRRYV